jgi:hypothetical protein
MAAKSKSAGPAKSHIARARKKRPGVHSKKKASKLKRSKKYTKRYVGQGK